MHDLSFPIASAASSVADAVASNSTRCEGRFDWTGKYLGQCATTDLEFAGLILGLSSIAFWLVAQAPQLFENFKNGRADSLSLFFLAEWLGGDVTNLVGCLLTNQVPTQTYTAVYFVIIDVIMLSQYLYLEKFKKRVSKKTTIQIAMFALCFVVGGVMVVTSASLTAREETYNTGRKLKHITAFDGTENTIGYVIGCVSGVMYLTSRIPQIVKNFRRKSTEGLAVAMFIMAILGNVTYAFGILMQSVKVDFIIDHLPWLVGSVGTLMFDMTIFIQSLIYRPKKTGEHQPLLDELAYPVDAS